MNKKTGGKMVYRHRVQAHTVYCKVFTVNLLQRKTAYSYQEKEHTLNRLMVNYSQNSAESVDSRRTSFPVYFFSDGNKRRKIRLIESHVKCRYLNKLTSKWTLRQVFICQRSLSLIGFCLGW